MKKIIFTLAAVGMLSACSLDETPYGFYSSDNFYKTEEDAESGLMYAYNALNYLEYLRGIWYLGDIPTETMYPKSDEPGDIHMLQQWTVNSETELTMYYFKYCYIGINRANTVIERVSGGNLNETVKNRVVGEALFLRAWNYFNLVRAYGRVPLYTEPLSSLEETTPQMAESIDKIYDRILEDLLAAEKMLTVNKVFGRIDKVGAQALLSKVYLTLASSIACKAPGYASAPRNADEMYTQAAYWSRKVVFDYKETYNFDSDLRSIYDVTKPDGPEHFAVRQYKKFLLSAGKTRSSILISCGARLAPFDIKELRDLMETDEMELDTIGDRKTALFVIISDTDDTFNFVVSILYTQLFNLLCDKADDEYGGRLPVHVRCLLDEFANIGQIPKFEKLIATIRSREISASIILQSQSQLKAIYKDNADTIVGNCDTTLFLGGKIGRAHV